MSSGTKSIKWMEKDDMLITVVPSQHIDIVFHVFSLCAGESFFFFSDIPCSIGYSKISSRMLWFLRDDVSIVNVCL